MRPDSCARAASGHAAAAPPSAASNSRRPMVTVIRPSRARCVKGNDTTPRACLSLTARHPWRRGRTSAQRSARFTSSRSGETMCGRAVFSEGVAARSITASLLLGAHGRLQGWRGRISLERVLVDRDGPAIVGSCKRTMRIAPEAHYYSSGCSSRCFMYSTAPCPLRERPNWPSS